MRLLLKNAPLKLILKFEKLLEILCYHKAKFSHHILRSVSPSNASHREDVIETHIIPSFYTIPFMISSDTKQYYPPSFGLFDTTGIIWYRYLSNNHSMREGCKWHYYTITITSFCIELIIETINRCGRECHSNCFITFDTSPIFVYHYQYLKPETVSFYPADNLCKLSSVFSCLLYQCYQLL